MPDEERARYIQGFRWCPYSETIQPWEEDQENGCLWCDVDMDTLGPHLKLVLARASDEAWGAYERLRDHVNTLEYAEMGEPEQVVAYMWSSYLAAAKSKTELGQITNLVRGMAMSTVIAVANGRWARLEHRTAIALRDALRTVIGVFAESDPILISGKQQEVLAKAQEVVEAAKLEDKPPEPPFAVNLDLPVPDPDPETTEPYTDPTGGPETTDGPETSDGPETTDETRAVVMLAGALKRTLDHHNHKLGTCAGCDAAKGVLDWALTHADRSPTRKLVDRAFALPPDPPYDEADA